MYNIKEYLDSITQTVYPGKRSVNGGFALTKLFNYIQAILYPYKDIGNPSEAGVFLNLFPIPLITALVLWIKSKKKDWLVAGIIIVSLLLTLYATLELPGFVSKITLLSYSLPLRTVDIVGYIQIILIVIIFSRYEVHKKLSPCVALTISIGVTVMAILVSKKNYPNYLSNIYIYISSVLFVFIGYGVMANISKKFEKAIMICFICISIITGVAVRPVVKGLDSIYSKPVAKKIEEIMTTDKNAKWLAYGGSFILPSYAVACGAPVINATNIYPNLELWHQLDPNRQYEEVYNRYAHTNLIFTDEKSSMVLNYPDNFTLNLSYDDIPVTGAKYILSLQDLSQLDISNSNIIFELIYMENSCYIYKILY
jgi:hypothetical protein